MGSVPYRGLWSNVTTFYLSIGKSIFVPTEISEFFLYEYEIFSILSIAHAWTSVILGEEGDKRRHSTTMKF